MNRQDVIDSLLSSGLLETCLDYQIRKQPQHYPNREDVLQDAWLWLLTYDENKLVDAYENKHLNALITRYLQNQIFSKTSDYYRKYIKFQNLTENAEGKASNI